MAVELLPLNKFKLINRVLVSGSLEEVYRVPVTATGVVLACQIANITPDLHTVDVIVEKGPSGSQVLDGNDPVDTGDQFELVTQGQIPGNDVFNPLTGRLILEETDKLFIRGSSNDIKINLSVLETANE